MDQEMEKRMELERELAQAGIIPQSQNGKEELFAREPAGSVEPAAGDTALTPEEEKIVDEYMNEIDLTDSASMMRFGTGAQKKVADFNENTLNHVRNKDLGEVSDLLNSVIMELKDCDSEEEKKGGLFQIFKKGGDKVTEKKLKYEKAEKSVERITQSLEQHQIQLMKDAAMFDKMYELNLIYLKDLYMYVVAGKRKLEEMRRVTLPSMRERAVASGLPEDAQAANDMEAQCGRFEKKIHDLELTRMVSLQMAPQIRLLQNNNTLMADKIQTTIVNTIPLWKSQLILAVGLSHADRAAKAQKEVSDLTNKLLLKNSEVLKSATTATAREMERGVVDIETLTQTNKALIETLDELVVIQEEGKKKRAAAQVELKRIEDELKQKLLDVR